MDGGFPFARLAAALGLSLTAHLVAAWGLGGMLGPPAPAGAGVLKVRLPEAVAEIPAASRLGGQARPAVAPRYWPAAQLDVRPQIKTHVMPEYPADLPSGVRGRVVLELYISRAGTLDRVRIVRAEPSGRFEQATLEAFKAARFTPGMRKGKAVPSLVRIEVSFGD